MTKATFEEIRRCRNPAFRYLMDRVISSMGPNHRRWLSCTYPEVSGHVNAIVQYALDRLDELGDALKHAVAGTFEENPTGERFILDKSGDSQRALFLDYDGELVTVRGATIERDNSSHLILETYRSYQILTGPQRGAVLSAADRPLPTCPLTTRRTSHAELPREPPPAVSLTSNPLSEPLPKMLGAASPRLFLSHAWVDKILARRIARRLSSRGFDLWVDDERMRPGDALPASIETAIRESTHFLVLLTRSSASSEWVSLEVAHARLVEGLRIIPLIGDKKVESDLLGRHLGVAVYDTTRIEVETDRLCEALAPGVSSLSWNEPALRQSLETLRSEHRLLAQLDLTASTARIQLEGLSPERIDLHAVESLIALTYDLAVANNAGDDEKAELVRSSAVAFSRVGAGTYAMEQFLASCDDPLAAHGVFSQFVSERLIDRDLVGIVQRLFDICRCSQHIALRWFVSKNFDRFDALEQQWAISYFVARAAETDNDAVFTAFCLLALMPDERILSDHIIRWIINGTLGFKCGVLNLADVETYFQCVADADEECQRALVPVVKVFRNHVRALARGNTFLERCAAAELLVCSKTHGYPYFDGLYEEFTAAPYTAEWKSCDLDPAMTDAFNGVARALKTNNGVGKAVLALLHAPREAELVAYCSDLSQASRLGTRLREEFCTNLIINAGCTVVIRGELSSSEGLAARLRSEGSIVSFTPMSRRGT